MQEIETAQIVARLEKDILDLKDPEFGYIRAGFPRFAALFGRDSCITSWELMDYDPGIAKTTLQFLTKYQGVAIDNEKEEEPGKILHEWHPHPAEYKSLMWPLPYYGSVDSTPLFLYLCGLYYEKETDTEWLEEEWPAIERALNWCKNYGDLDGDILLEYERKNPSGLMHQGWKDSTMNHLDIAPPVELVEVQGYYYAGLRRAAEIALALKHADLAMELGKRADQLKENCLKEFWQPEIKFFASALSQSKFADLRIMSNPGHLLFSGILDGEEEKIEALVNRLFEKDMWTPYGIRTHASSNPDFNAMSYHLGSIWPHDNWIIAQGLKKYGYENQYQKIKNGLLAAYRELKAIPELFAYEEGNIRDIPVACVPQAWSSGALLNFLSEK